MSKKKRPFAVYLSQHVGSFAVQLAKEASTIPGYAGREMVGNSKHTKKPTCSLKKGWFG